MHIIPGLMCHLLCKPYNFRHGRERALIIQRDRNMGSLSAWIRVKEMSSTKKEGVEKKKTWSAGATWRETGMDI